MPNRLLLPVVLVMLLCGCSGPGFHGNESDSLEGFSTALPAGKLASDINLEPSGSEFLFASDQGVSTDGSAADINAASLNIAFVVYGTALPEGFALTSITVELDQPDTEFWLAYSDYGVGDVWELHGPYDSGSPLQVEREFPLAQSGRYVSAQGSTYWAVIVGRPNSVRVLGSTVVVSEKPLLGLPPAGDYQADSASSLYPDLLLLPGDSTYGPAGAPVIAYTSLADALPELYLAYYDGTAWQHKRIDTERSLVQPQLLITSGGIRVIAQEPATGVFHDYTLDSKLEIAGSDSFAGPTSPPLFAAAADGYNFGTFAEPDEEIILAAAFSSDTNSELWLMSWTQSEGWTEEHTPIAVEDQITGATLRFSPVGGWPLMAFSHGTFDTTGSLLIDTSLVTASRDAGSWLILEQDVVINSMNQSPLGLDVGFMEDGSPQLVAVAARDFVLLDFTSSLFLDVAVGSQGDETWFFERAFTSEIGVELNFPPTEATITLAVAPFATWARPNGLIHFRVDGEITVDIQTQQPTGGTADSSTEFRSKPFIAWNKSGYYTGSPGIQFSFGDYRVGGGCAYIKAGAISVEDLLAGEFALENELRYWTPD